MSVRLLAAILEVNGIQAQFIEATQLIITDRNYQSAHPDLELTRTATRNILEPILAQGKVPVVTGFIASTPEGSQHTGARGSDYTAAVLGAVLPAEDVWIWTDVDGVMSADPRIVPMRERSQFFLTVKLPRWLILAPKSFIQKPSARSSMRILG